MIKYEVPSILRDKITLASGDINMIDRKENDITIFPDYVSKRTNTIASGVVIKSADSIYPCAVPDLGCSFHIVELEGICEDDLKQCPILFEQLDRLLSGEMAPLFNADKLDTVRDMIVNGHNSTSYIFEENRIKHYENNGKYEIDSTVPLSATIFPTVDNVCELNRYQGHFMEILVSSDENNPKVYLLIHSGCHTLADRFMLHYYPMFAKLSYKNRWSNKEQVISGKFRVPVDSGYERTYFNDVNGLMNFAIAYRDIIEYSVVKLMKEILDKDIKAKLLSDYAHTKVSWSKSGVIHQRGIQYLKAGYDNIYLMSGFYGVKSMLFTVENDGFFSHGSQSKPEFSEDGMCDADEMIAYQFLNNIVSDTTVKQARLAKTCYDYCLSKKARAVDYLRPVYSFKID